MGRRRKHRVFKKKNEGFSPQQMKVVVGILIGGLISTEKIDKKYYRLVKKTAAYSTQILIQDNIIKSLIQKEMIEENRQRKLFTLTAKGFNIIMSKIDRMSVK